MSFMAPGQVVWFEIGTREASTAEKFYGELLGWNFEVDPDSSVDGRRYIRIMAPEAPWPMGAISESGSGGEQINVSVFSEDVSADVDRLCEAGATVLVPATQVADVTWFAVLADPQGNPFSLFSRTSNEDLKDRAKATEEHFEQSSYAPSQGSFAWFEIGTTDADATRAFYSQAFGWRFERDETAGGKPYYNVFTGNQWPSGGMYDHGAQGTDYVMPSFLSGDVAAQSKSAENLGAVIEFGPDSNPDGLVYSRIVDPNGNRFGLFSMPTQS
ncbi:VOC family protein [Nocardia uniformis]|uniref:VOC family protein n=1 Tax=Nocardia uniformis TaxID=53432 RepID=A0A849BUF1_9NOCA|nr:VOC family protein [Nocardia uniformis]NNH68658.1 VOC family protein [Nocardia uniformis]